MHALGLMSDATPRAVTHAVACMQGVVFPTVIELRNTVEKILDPPPLSCKPTAPMEMGRRFESDVRDMLITNSTTIDKVVQRGFEIHPSNHRKGFSPDAWLYLKDGSLLLLEVKLTLDREAFDAIATLPLSERPAKLREPPWSTKGVLQQVTIGLGTLLISLLLTVPGSVNIAHIIKLCEFLYVSWPLQSCA